MFKEPLINSCKFRLSDLLNKISANQGEYLKESFRVLLTPLTYVLKAMTGPFDNAQRSVALILKREV